MPTINKDDMTITIVCQSEDEAGARVELQELLEANPGYKPVLTVEDPVGNEITHTDLSAPAKSRSSRAQASEVVEEAGEPAEEAAEEPATEDEAVEDASEEEATDEEPTTDEA
jgi:hypothetical protein